MIVHGIGIFDFFIYSESTEGATICTQGASPYVTDTPSVVKIIIPMDPMFSIEMKGRSNIP